MQRSIGHLVSLVHLTLKHELNGVIGQYHLNAEQWGLINSIYLNESISQTALAKLTTKDQASVTRMLDKLIQKGYVFKEYHSQDKRSFMIYLTDDGRKLRNKVFPLTQSIINEATKDFSSLETEQLQDLLNRILQNLE